MNFDQWTKLIGLLLPFLQSLIWPALILFVLLFFSGTLKKFIGNIGEFSGKVSTAGVEITAKKELEVATTTASAALVVAEATKTENEIINEQAFYDNKVREIAQVVNEAITPQNAKKLAGTTILWINALPNRNIYERIALHALGIQINVINSLGNALDKLQRKEERGYKYDCIVLDIEETFHTNNEVRRLLEILRRSDVFIIVYITHDGKHEIEELFRQGVYRVVHTPRELFESVVRAIETKPLASKYLSYIATKRKYEVEEATLKWLKSNYPENKFEGKSRDPFSLSMIEPDNQEVGIEIIDLADRNLALQLWPSRGFVNKEVAEEFGLSATWYILVCSDEITTMKCEEKLRERLTRIPGISEAESFFLGYLGENNEFIQTNTIQGLELQEQQRI